MRFDILYHFSAGAVHVIETKRLDLPAEAGPDMIYRWSFVSPDGVKPLTFVSMELQPQRRIFKEGWIEFDLNQCEGELFGVRLSLTKQEKISDSLRVRLGLS